MAAVGVLAGAAMAAATVDAERQQRADEAIAGFTERMEELGFVSTGPGGFDDDTGTDDDVPEECADFVAVFVGLEEQLSDDVARADSDSFEFGAVDGTDPVDLDALDDLDLDDLDLDDLADLEDLADLDDLDFGALFDFGSEVVWAMVSIVEEGSDADLVGAVTALTSEEVVGCLEDIVMADFLDDDDDLDGMFPEPSLDVGVEPDLGVGEASGSLEISMEMWLFVPITMDLTMVIATDDDVLVAVAHMTLNLDEAPSGLDLVSELEALLDSAR